MEFYSPIPFLHLENLVTERYEAETGYPGEDSAQVRTERGLWLREVHAPLDAGDQQGITLVFAASAHS